MSRIIIITYKSKGALHVSHGVCEDTFKNICLSPEPLDTYISAGNAKFDEDLGEWYIPETERQTKGEHRGHD